MKKVSLRKFASIDQVREYAQKQNKVLVVHEGLILDVTSFCEQHPGGGLMLRNSHLKGIEQQMKFHQPLTVQMADTMAIGSFQKEIEQMIDPKRSLFQQILEVDHQTYIKITTSPHWMFSKSPRLFENDILEYMSKNRWYSVVTPPVLIAIYHFYSVKSWQTFNLLTFILTILLSMFFFTINEYTMHRYVFHCESRLPDNKILRILHYFTHAVHHTFPNDPYRLALPSYSFMLIYYLIIELGMKKIMVINDPVIYATFWAVYILSYASYDTLHYAIHNIPSNRFKGTWFHKSQIYHYRHHFSGEEAGFGVTSPLWDIILGSGFKEEKKQ